MIPAAIGRPTSKPPTGHYRRLMKARLHAGYCRYGQRWQAETGFSMAKGLPLLGANTGLFGFSGGLGCPRGTEGSVVACLRFVPFLRPPRRPSWLVSPLRSIGRLTSAAPLPNARARATALRFPGPCPPVAVATAAPPQRKRPWRSRTPSRSFGIATAGASPACGATVRPGRVARRASPGSSSCHPANARTRVPPTASRRSCGGGCAAATRRKWAAVWATPPRGSPSSSATNGQTPRPRRSTRNGCCSSWAATPGACSSGTSATPRSGPT